MYAWVVPLAQAIEEVIYKDWQFHVGIESNGSPFLQIQFDDNGQWQYCRKWLLYPTMNKSEAVRTAWLAVLAAEEHEARERFRYKNRRVMNPHFDIDELADFARLAAHISPTEDPVPA